MAVEDGNGGKSLTWKGLYKQITKPNSRIYPVTKLKMLLKALIKELARVFRIRRSSIQDLQVNLTGSTIEKMDEW